MNVQLEGLAKRFNKEWIFKNVSHSFKSGSSTGIIGSNGSGKSTLIKLISGAEIPSEGKIVYQIEQAEIEVAEIYKELCYAAPYIDLIEELTCEELVEFHLKFKAFQQDLSTEAFLELLYLTDSRSKYVKNFSSGMKQRLKLGLAICTESKLLLLDEPCSNLDAKGIELYHTLLNSFNKNRTTIIGSNEQTEELYKVEDTLRITDYK